jgi:hypothetical protein
MADCPALDNKPAAGRIPFPAYCIGPKTGIGFGKQDAAHKAQNLQLIRWSIQEIRRVAARLAQRRAEPSYAITWSLRRRAHQAAEQQAHLKSKMTISLIGSSKIGRALGFIGLF